MSETKLCPACAEEIKAAALKCKHCGEELGEKPSSGPVSGAGLIPAMLIVVGVGLFAYAMTMDVTVDSGTSYGRVANIHLIAQQGNYRNGGAVMALMGLIWAALGNRGHATSSQVGTSRVPSVDLDGKLPPQQKQVLGLALGTLVFLCLLYVYSAAKG